jgi:hypothetical protein
MTERLEHLADWGLPPVLMAMARGELPHPAFDALCEPIQSRERWQFPDLDLSETQVLREVGDRQGLALWEHDHGDGHSFEVMYCCRTGDGLEFVHVMYADDMDGPLMRAVAKSEQGLYFWLFFHLIGSEFFRHGEGAYLTLVAAAKSVGFNFIVEVFRLEQEIGTDDQCAEKLRQKSLEIL